MVPADERTSQVPCPRCGAEFESEGQLESHQRAAHDSADRFSEDERREAELDAQLRDSFPASDPPSTSPVTGVGAPANGHSTDHEPADGVTDNAVRDPSDLTDEPASGAPPTIREPEAGGAGG